MMLLPFYVNTVLHNPASIAFFLSLYIFHVYCTWWIKLLNLETHCRTKSQFNCTHSQSRIPFELAENDPLVVCIVETSLLSAH